MAIGGMLASAVPLELLGLLFEALDGIVGRRDVTHSRLLLYANHGCSLPGLAYKGNRGLKSVDLSSRQGLPW